MKFLSLSNPWPWAIFHPDPEIRKEIENRNWAPSIEQIGQRIAIHVAKSWDKSAFSYFTRVGVTGFPARFDLYPSAKIIGVVTLDRIRHGSPVDLPTDLHPSQRRWFFGPIGWYLVDPIVLPTPIEMKGAQGLRTLPDEIAAQVTAQLELATPLPRRAA